MEKYKEGTIFELFENDNQDYIILKNVKLDDVQYLVVAPVEGNIDNLKMNTKKMMIIKVNEDDSIDIIDDESIIGSVVENMF